MVQDHGEEKGPKTSVGLRPAMGLQDPEQDLQQLTGIQWALPIGGDYR